MQLAHYYQSMTCGVAEKVPDRDRIQCRHSLAAGPSAEPSSFFYSTVHADGDLRWSLRSFPFKMSPTTLSDLSEADRRGGGGGGARPPALSLSKYTFQ